MADASVSGFRASNARSDDTVFNMTSSSIDAASVEDGRMPYGPGLGVSSLEYGSVANVSSAATDYGGPST